MLNARVLSLSVLTDEDSVDIVIGSLEALNGQARADVREQVEGPAQRQIERNVALANCVGCQDARMSSQGCH